MTIFYKCENCDQVSDDIDQINLKDWASCPDQADIYGLPAGTCTECGAPVYEEGTFDKLDAARAMLAALEKMWAAYGENMERHGMNGDDTWADVDHDAWRDSAGDARAAIAAAKAAGIAPAPLTK